MSKNTSKNTSKNISIDEKYNLFQNSSEDEVKEFFNKKMHTKIEIVYDFNDNKIGIITSRNIIDIENDMHIIEEFYKWNFEKWSFEKTIETSKKKDIK